ncbi:hypothetical protein AK830_g4410 [Neonectria ditissima]|uniref:Tubulin--tyrosine ligase PBY1 n=1 Tax=Neonectria ditissima TaxID=78410 RepID=A0A0P7B6H9_9HYPO|nr:hypothetical protein AK830_g4410 [Neonectria ditissima]
MHAFIQGACPWLDEHVKSHLRKHVPDVIFIDDFADFPTDAETIFQFCDGWNLNQYFAVLNTADKALINAYPNSDALARKDFLARVVEYWTAKRPDSILKNHVPLTVRLSLDYSEYLDDSLTAADDLTLLYSLEENEDKVEADREWWILKPALIDCGAGIRIFSTVEELASNLELAADIEEEDELSEDYETAREPVSEKNPYDSNPDEFSPSLSNPGLSSLDALITTTGNLTLSGAIEKNQKPPALHLEINEDERIPSAQMREFVAQRYIVSVPLLENRKWHARAYVLSVGRLKVHVFREMLALLAIKDYEPPWKNPGLGSSLTNTALQGDDEIVSRGSMRDFLAAPDDLLPGDWKARIFDQICEVSAELFRATAHTMADRFTPLNKCFELFAVDFLIDSSGNPWLLEVNETPAFYEHGVAGEIAQRLMESVICVVMEHMGKAKVGDPQNSEARARMIEVLDETEKLAKSNIKEIVPES